ncbi:MAG TPA: transcription antitermination factor NusB [Acidobacteriota bacterium]|jgi:16S rRNA (cytosine967-C5)-methyltransferase|nr:transcription antitermination factor NusB [Acidobacteriota bacterium]
MSRKRSDSKNRTPHSEIRIPHSNARSVAVNLLLQIDVGRLSSQDLFSHEDLSALPDNERALAYEIVLGTLRWRSTIDWLIEKAGSREIKRIDPVLLHILRSAVFQLRFLHKVPEYAAVDEGVELAHRRSARAAGFVNAVLRQYLRTKPELPEGQSVNAVSARTSHPAWLLKRWIMRFGEDRAERIALENNCSPDVAIRWNIARGDIPPQVRSQRGFHPCPSLYGCFHLGERPVVGIEGENFVYQDEASQLVAHIPSASSNPSSILDVCSAPGGKAVLLAERFLRAHTVLMDSSLRRLKVARERIQRWGGRRMCYVVNDATVAMVSRRQFALVFVDAPCSGLGTIRRNPEIKWRVTERTLLSQREKQRKILENASQQVAPGGQLVYTTCSTEPEENEQVVDEFLSGSLNFRKQSIESEEVSSYVSHCVFSTMGRYPEIDGFFAFLLRRR